MKYNLVSYDKKGFPVFRYSNAINVCFFYKYSANYKKCECLSIGPNNSKSFLSFSEEGKDYKKEIEIGDNLFWSKTTNGIKITTFKVIPDKNSIYKKVELNDGKKSISIEKHKGEISVFFKITEEVMNNYKRILHGKWN